MAEVFDCLFMIPPTVEMDTFEETLTQQQFLEECDINEIMRRYEETGEWIGDTAKEDREAVYGDYKAIEPDYMSVLGSMTDMEAAFAALPAHIRTQFSNSPKALFDWLMDPDNTAEAIALGIVSDDFSPT